MTRPPAVAPSLHEHGGMHISRLVITALGCQLLIACGGEIEPTSTPAPLPPSSAPTPAPAAAPAPGPEAVSSTGSAGPAESHAQADTRMKVDLDDETAAKACALQTTLPKGTFTADDRFSVKNSVRVSASQDAERNTAAEGAPPSYYNALWLRFTEAPTRAQDPAHGLTRTEKWVEYAITVTSPTPRADAFARIGVAEKVNVALVMSGHDWCAADGTGGGEGGGAPDGVEATMVVTARTKDTIEAKLSIDGLSHGYEWMNGMKLELQAPLTTATAASGAAPAEAVCCLR